MGAGSCCSLAAYALRSPKILMPAYHRRLWQGILGPRASGPQMLWGMVGVATFIPPIPPWEESFVTAGVLY